MQFTERMSSTELLRRVSRAAIGAAVAALLLAGCESMNFSIGKKIDYKSSGSAPSLEVPPDLTTPTYDDRYQVATASGVAAARAAGRSTELLPVASDARLARSGSERWLVVKTTQEAAWTTLRDFWTRNGFVIAVEQPGLSRACVIDKSLTWCELGQYHCRNFWCEPGTGIATKLRCVCTPKVQARRFAVTLNARPEFRKMRLALRTSGGPDGCRGTPKVRRT